MSEIPYSEQISADERQPARFRLEVFYLVARYSATAPFGD